MIPLDVKRIKGLDSLRGVAILAVLVYHAASTAGSSPAAMHQLIAWLRSFLWAGVDIFFVLSGFLITGILLRTREKTHFFSIFYARRSLRVFPLFYLFAATIIFLPLILSAVVGNHAIVASESYQRLWHGQAWVWLYLHNFIQAKGPSQLPGMGHLWSLAVEEQFYIFWPWLVWRTDLARLRNLLLLILFATSIGRLVVSLSGYSPWAIMHLTWFRLDGLVIGSLLAVLHKQTDWTARWRRRRSWIFLGALAAILIVALKRSTFEWIDPAVQQLGFFSVALASGCVVDWVVERDKRPEPGSPSTIAGFLAAWGKYSYAIYIFHMPIIHAIRWLMPELGDGWVTLVSAIVSFAVGFVSWHAYEMHWLHWKPEYGE